MDTQSLKCRVCDTLLTKENWLPSFIKIKKLVCIDCNHKYRRALRTAKYSYPLMQLPICCKCGTVLFPEDNWLKSDIKYHHHICKVCHKKKTNEYRIDNPPRVQFRTPKQQESYRFAAKQYRLRLRRRVNEALGGSCANPFGIDHLAFENHALYEKCLQIDHINGNGCKELKKYYGDSRKNYYLHVLKSVERGEKRYQLLCANCNWIKKSHKNEHAKGGVPKQFIDRRISHFISKKRKPKLSL